MSVIDWNTEARNILKAVRAVGYLEGMSATLWRLAGPEIADEAIVDYDRSVADIVALLGLEKRDYEEIVETRDKAVAVLESMGYEVVNTLFTDEDMKGHSNMKIPLYIPLHYLAMSLESMSSCNVIYFCPGWENARGCRIEHDAAAEYGLEVMYG